jgi:integrase
VRVQYRGESRLSQACHSRGTPAELGKPSGHANAGDQALFLLVWQYHQAGGHRHRTANAGRGICQVWIEGAHAHRFRHTLATEILRAGRSEQDAADILGISAAIVRKHYSKWSQARQQRITRLFQAILSWYIFGT